MKNLANLFMRWLPLAVVIVCVFNAIIDYSTDNTHAFLANLVAIAGWLVIAIEGLQSRNIEE